jgi:transposase InsO family protein
MEMEPKVKMRLGWVQMYQRTQNAGLVCRRCGICRPTLRKWGRRYEQLGLEGLVDQSRRPKTCQPNKVWATQVEWILELRRTRKLGARRLPNELQRLYGLSLSTRTIDKVLKQAQVKPLRKTRRIRKGKRRYQKDIPGERGQMDVCKIAPKMYQYTAIDDCTRLKVIRLYPNKEATSTLDLIAQVVAEFPFPIQRIQTDRGEEFMAHKVQRRLMALKIKYRPTKPRSPDLNGKVERSQRTDLDEFYDLIDLQVPDLLTQLRQWQDYYNRDRKHGSINQTPWQKWETLKALTPTPEEVQKIYGLKTERIRDADYRADCGKPRRVIRL